MHTPLEARAAEFGAKLVQAKCMAELVQAAATIK
jgi:hypothetical protein